MDSLEFVAPAHLAEVLTLLNEYGSDARVLAGGTDLVNSVRKGKCPAKLIIGLRQVKELNDGIRDSAGGLIIGGLATLDDIARSAIVQQRFAAVAEAAEKVGSKQIRNRATMVGNICNASPAADTVPPLLVHDAVVNIAGIGGTHRSVPLEQFVKAPGTIALNGPEIVESLFLPYSRALSGSAYAKLSRREGVDLAIVGAAAYTDDAGDVKLALGAVGPKAFRAREAEGLLKSGNWRDDPEFLLRGIREALLYAHPISDLRASRNYRLAMIEVMIENALRMASERIHDKRG